VFGNEPTENLGMLAPRIAQHRYGAPVGYDSICWPDIATVDRVLYLLSPIREPKSATCAPRSSARREGSSRCAGPIFCGSRALSISTASSADGRSRTYSRAPLPPSLMMSAQRTVPI
jgi:hypothetical protein